MKKFSASRLFSQKCVNKVKCLNNTGCCRSGSADCQHSCRGHWWRCLASTELWPNQTALLTNNKHGKPESISLNVERSLANIWTSQTNVWSQVSKTCDYRETSLLVGRGTGSPSSQIGFNYHKNVIRAQHQNCQHDHNLFQQIGKTCDLKNPIVIYEIYQHFDSQLNRQAYLLVY